MLRSRVTRLAGSLTTPPSAQCVRRPVGSEVVPARVELEVAASRSGNAQERDSQPLPRSVRHSGR